LFGSARLERGYEDDKEQPYGAGDGFPTAVSPPASEPSDEYGRICREAGIKPQQSATLKDCRARRD
jgi:hypothetical protein